MIKNNKHCLSGLRRFLVLWLSQSISSMGTAMTNYALTLWVYQQNETASDITLLTLCSYLPTILFRFAAGAVADRWDKKRIMLACDFVAACGTVAVFALYVSSALTVTWLYAISFLLSFMNAFQSPAAYVATSLLVPKEQYAKASGLQAVSDAAISILAPVLGSMVLVWGCMPAVLSMDLISFGIALLALLFIPVPKPINHSQIGQDSFWQNCLSGLKYLKKRSDILQMILFFAVINFLAKLGGDGLLSAFILSRTHGNQTILGIVQSSVALGILTGGMMMTVMKPFRSSVKTIFITCGLTFLVGNVGMSFSRTVLGWCLASFISYLFAAIMNVYWQSMMRLSVPLAMQGRVFSARDTIQNGTIPLGLYLGGVFADNVFEPFMSKPSAVQGILAAVFGHGKGSGMAVMFFFVGTVGFLFSIGCMNRRVFQSLDHPLSKDNHRQ